MASLLDKVQDAVRKGTVGAEVKRSAQWFRDKIKGLEGTLRNQWSTTNAPKFYREAENKMDRKVSKLKGNLGALYATSLRIPYSILIALFMFLPARSKFSTIKLNGSPGVPILLGIVNLTLNLLGDAKPFFAI